MPIGDLSGFALFYLLGNLIVWPAMGAFAKGKRGFRDGVMAAIVFTIIGIIAVVLLGDYWTSQGDVEINYGPHMCGRFEC